MMLEGNKKKFVILEGSKEWFVILEGNKDWFWKKVGVVE